MVLTSKWQKYKFNPSVNFSLPLGHLCIVDNRRAVWPDTCMIFFSLVYEDLISTKERRDRQETKTYSRWKTWRIKELEVKGKAKGSCPRHKEEAVFFWIIVSFLLSSSMLQTKWIEMLIHWAWNFYFWVCSQSLAHFY